MGKFKLWIRAYWIVLLFALAKLLVHLLTATNYGFQRDAYLYLAQSQHLDWGFFSTPPLTALITRIHTLIWGDSLLAVRLLPALIGALSIFLVGWLIKELKGGAMALVAGLSAYFLSPAFLRPAALLQPTIFNHLFWLLAAIVICRMISRQDPKLLLWMIPVLGLGWMAKYSIIFYGFALLAALIISRQRRLLWSPYLPVALAGGMLVILPNLVWQHANNWPVFTHMSELQETQLGNVLLKDFLFAQVFMHLPALPVWLGGLIWLTFNRKHSEYRIFAWAFVLTLALIILLKGKFYYTIAAYTILVVFGSLAWEHWAARSRQIPVYIVLFLMLSSGLFVLPFSLPVYKPDRMVEYDKKILGLGMDMMLKWEDGKVHDLPQDYADMVGWDELGEKVWTFYETLHDTIRDETWIFGEFYGCAGAARYYRPDPSYPDVYSFNDAFMEWIPRKPEFKHLIYMGYSDRVPLYFKDSRRVGTVDHPHFREKGLPIWFGSFPTPKLYEDWEESWKESKGRFTRNLMP
ncbi:MAG: glycosyltransferase family 39 protein [Bacteroidetes bacterium]|nr:MAG: glycosyltransferase family 39 protein [Bacteroidota bacterium]